MPTRVIWLACVLVVAVTLPPNPVHADIAPPETPPGASLVPANEATWVRMVSETVNLSISADPASAERAIARTRAVFTMRNLGRSEERMQVRFPLSFFDGSSDGRFEFPEIPSIAVRVDGKGVPTRREMQPPLEDQAAYRARDELPWAVFDVSFPPSQDVVVEVTYTVRGYGYYPEAIFKYVLETGAGWNDTIGSADIVAQLPYDASESNVFVHESNVASQSTPGGDISGNEIRWHYEDLEPTWESNIEVILIAPALWGSVLKETGTVTRNPKDGEAWGRLAKAYKEAARLPKGWLRDDPAGRDMLELSKNAYEKCLALLPEDALWHYGYADLLWSEYYWGVRSSRKGDTQGLLPRALTELQTTLALDPDNSLAKDLLTEISMAVDGAVELNGDDYVFLALTATPLPPTAYGEIPTETPWVAATDTITPNKPANVPTMRASPEPTAGNPLCGGVALFLGLPVAGLILWRRRRIARL
ncbi:MAG: hypothetical protein V1755_01910 [Chloroflexota bacterium]